VQCVSSEFTKCQMLLILSGRWTNKKIKTDNAVYYTLRSNKVQVLQLATSYILSIGFSEISREQYSEIPICDPLKILTDDPCRTL